VRRLSRRSREAAKVDDRPDPTASPDPVSNMSPFDSPAAFCLPRVRSWQVHSTRPEPCRRPRSLRQSSGSPEQGRGAHGRPTDGEHDERGSGATESTPTQLSSATRRRNLT